MVLHIKMERLCSKPQCGATTPERKNHLLSDVNLNSVSSKGSCRSSGSRHCGRLEGLGRGGEASGSIPFHPEALRFRVSLRLGRGGPLLQVCWRTACKVFRVSEGWGRLLQTPLSRPHLQSLSLRRKGWQFRGAS